MFYVMLALRAELRQRGIFAAGKEPNLADLLDLVALGTVADVVPLDRNNRVLVAQGLQRIRAGRMQAGIKALFAVAGRAPANAAAFDLGFAIGPRINATGRLADMALGIEALTTDDDGRALNIAKTLDGINRERRVIEADMREAASTLLDNLDATSRASLTRFDPGWHQGVSGILAGRVREQLHRPTFVFARGNAGELKGSGRSITGLHLRDALDLVAKRRPKLLRRFGGHAAAAGLALMESDLAEFETEFEAVAQALLSPAALQRTLVTDGALEEGYRGLDTARLLQAEIWGQAFPAPVFADVFEVENQKLLQDKHLKLTLRQGKSRYEAIRFNSAEPAPARIEAAYRLDINEWNGLASVQLLIEDFRAAV
jgi:single-stranded-DNA-specific exonuclease